MMRPIRDSNLNPKAHAFEPGKTWKGQAPKPGDAPASPGAKAAASPQSGSVRPDLRIAIPERLPTASPTTGHAGSSGSPPRSQEEWEALSQNLRRHQSLAPLPSPMDRPGRPLNPLRPPGAERTAAKQVETDMADKKRTKNDMSMFFDGDIPHEPAGKRAPTPGEQAVLKDFDKQRRAYRDPDTGEDFSDLRNRGEFSATYDVRPKPDGTGKTAVPREFNYDRGNTSHMSGADAIPPHMRVHSHPDFTLPIPSPQDHRVAAANYAAHGEKNYLVTPQNKAYQFGPSKDGPQYTQLSPIDLKTPTEAQKNPGTQGSPGLAPSPKDASPKSASSSNSDEYWADFKPGT